MDRVPSPPSGPTAVCFPFIGDRVGGSHVSALKLIAGLDPARFAPVVAVHAADGPVERLFAEHGTAVERLPSLGERAGGGARVLARGLRLAGALAAFLRERNVAVVHTNDGYTHASWALPAKLAGARHVWHHRTVPDVLGLRFLAPLAADRVISVSRFAAPRPGPWSAAGKCEVVHSPFDAGRPAPDRAACRDAALAELGLPPETRLLGFFGTLVPRKRPLAFVEAVAALRRSAPGLPVAGLVFGQPRDGMDEAASRLARELGVSEAIRLMGFRFPAERWLAACDVLLVPAVDEPFGRTLIEAMLLGTPVVAARSGGNPEALDHGRTGFLVPPDAPEALAGEALALLTRPERHAAVARAAQAEARSRFGVDRHVERVMAVYDRVLAGRGRTGAASRGTAEDRACAGQGG